MAVECRIVFPRVELFLGVVEVRPSKEFDGRFPFEYTRLQIMIAGLCLPLLERHELLGAEFLCL
jgi:hypothetical protein